MRFFRLLPLLFTRFRKEIRMAWGMMTHRETPMFAKLMILFAGLYLVSPIDIVPDFIPVLGLMDDASVLALLFTFAYKLLPKALYDTLRAKADGVTPAAVPTSTHEQPATARPRREPQTIDVTPEK